MNLTLPFFLFTYGTEMFRATEFYSWLTQCKGILLLVAILATSSGILAIHPAQDFWYPFHLTVATDSDINLRALNDRYAGERGFLRATDGGHLAFEKTPRHFERFWGAQFLFAAQHPTHREADTIAAQFARLGFNLWKPGGLQYTINTSLVTNIVNKEERFDRFDYLFQSMKHNGVYCYLQLNEYGIARIVSDGKLEGSEHLRQLGLTRGRYYQYLMDPEIWGKEKDYWRVVLSHRNPYTGLRYAHDPSLIVVELTNENYILDGWLNGSLNEKTLTPYYWSALREKWNHWLTARYHARKTVQSAWNVAGAVALRDSEDPTISTVAFEPAVPYDEEYSKHRKSDLILFLVSLQQSYLDSARTFLRSLGVRALLNAGQSTSPYGVNPELLVASSGDLMDVHPYFDNPSEIGEKGAIQDLNPFEIKSMFNKYFWWGNIEGVAASNSIDRKPFFLSETNWSYPNEHQYLFLPRLSAYASFQDWDGIIIHAYAAKMPWDSIKNIESQLVIRNNSLLMAQTIAAALSFRSGFISTAQSTLHLSYDPNTTAKDLLQQMIYPSYDRFPRILCFPIPSKTGKLDALTTDAVLVHGVRKDFRNVPMLKTEEFGSPYTTDTKEITFDIDKESFQLSTTRAITLAGKFGIGMSQSTTKGSLKLEIESEGYASFTLISLDRDSIAASTKVLLTAVSQVRNSNTQWKQQFKSVNQWGTGPVLLRGVQAAVALSGVKTGRFEVWALDEAGKPKQEIYQSLLIERGLKFHIDPQMKTAFFEIVRK